MNYTRTGALILGFFIFLGLVGASYLGTRAVLDVKNLERSVTVKGLAEREYPADIVIWPVQFTEASNSLQAIYTQLDANSGKIRRFLVDNGIAETDLSLSPPAIIDKSAQPYGGGNRGEFRYTATQAVTVYSTDISTARKAMKKLGNLGREGIVFTGGDYQSRTEYLFTRLNEIKPAMIEEATTKAREVAEKFAQDSNSRLGKIKQASQGQFTISDRDSNNPHIKNVRVVSTIEYYLSD